MAQNVTVAGASYQDVPSILLPKTGGGTASFVDTTISTNAAAASDIASGKLAYVNGSLVTGTASGGGGGGSVTQDQDGFIVLPDEGGGSVTVEALNVTQNGTYTAPAGTAYSPVTVNVSGGGGGGGDMTDPIRFFDYDGTLVASYSSVPASLPSVPSHTGLTNGAWNHTLAQITTQFNAMGTCDVGANYDTESGATEIDIELQDGRLHPYLSLAVNGTVEIDWGDNSTSTSTGTSLTTRKSDIHHEYAAAGSYTIKISKTSGTGYSLYCSSTYTLLNKNSSTANANRVYSNCVKTARIGDDCALGNSAFNNCYALASVSIPSSVTSTGTSVFSNCYSLESVSLPSDMTSVNGNAFNNCYALASVSIPSSVTSIGNSVFNNCYAIASVSIPSSVTSIGIGTFSYCYSLASISIPSSVTAIDAQAFNNCYGMAEYHFKPTTTPTLANTNVFTGIQSDCVMYVPSASLTAYQTANNWSTYSSYMVGE